MIDNKIRDILEQHGDAIRLHTAMIERLGSMQQQIDSQQDQIDILKQRLPIQLEDGIVPAGLTGVDMIECQIFYRPLETIPAKHRRVKTEWSLRIDVYVGARKADPAINVGLYVADQFCEQVAKVIDLPPKLRVRAAMIKGEIGTVAGRLKLITKGKGRPYVSSQFCIMTGHQTDQPVVKLFVDNMEVVFDEFRPGKGTKATRAKWYAKKFV